MSTQSNINKQPSTFNQISYNDSFQHPINVKEQQQNQILQFTNQLYKFAFNNTKLLSKKQYINHIRQAKNNQSQKNNNCFSKTVTKSFNKFQSTYYDTQSKQQNFNTTKQKLRNRVATEAVFSQQFQDVQFQSYINKGKTVKVPDFDKVIAAKRSLTVHKSQKDQVLKRLFTPVQVNFNRNTLKTRKKINSKTIRTQQKQLNKDSVIIELKNKTHNKNFLNIQQQQPQIKSRRVSVRSVSINPEKSLQQLGKIDENYHNNFKQIQKKHNINADGLTGAQAENWLNNLLIQYCTDQKFDTTIQNSALKKFNVDKNSLLSQGINPKHIQRVYKSLFVYSIGFNNFLREISLNRNNKANFVIRKSLWKVYAILLEYSGQGSFQATLAEIQRDKKKYMEYLKSQLQKKQYLIDNNDLINQQKNAKIFKEQKRLKAMNQQLIMQKQILQQDLRQMEMGFNHQVQLRLKFQSKINELHGVYRQLLQKHSSLYAQYKANSETIQKYKRDVDFKSNQCLKFQIIVNTLKNQISALKEELKVLQKQGKQTRDRKKAAVKELYEMKTENQKLMQTQGTHEKFKVDVKIKLNSHEKQIDRMRRKQVHILQQNVDGLNQIKNLQKTIGQQTIQINDLLKKEKDFNLNVADVKAESVHLKKKIIEIKSQLDQKKNRVQSLQQQVAKLINELQVQQKINKQIIQLNQIYQKRAIENKLTFQKLQSQSYIENQKFNDLQQLFNTHMQQLKALRLRSQQLEFQNSDLRMKQISLLSQIQILQTAQGKDKDANKKAMDKHKKDNQSAASQLQLLAGQKNMLQIQVQEFKQAMNKAHKNFLQSKFENQDIHLKYKQTLSVIQGQQKHLKQLKRNISELVDENGILKRYQNIKRKQLQYLQIQISRRIVIYEKQNSNLKQIVHQKKLYYHPMQFQDLYQKTYKLKQKYQESLQNIKKLEIKKNNQIQNLAKKLQQTINKLNYITKTSKKQIQLLTQSLKVQRISSFDNNKKFEQSTSIKNIEINKITKQLNQIKIQKNNLKKNFDQKIMQNKTLLEQLQKLQDGISALKQNYAHYEEKVRQKDQIILNYSEQIKQLEMQKQNLEKKIIMMQKMQKKSAQKQPQNEKQKQLKAASKHSSKQTNRQPKQKTEQVQQNQEQQIITLKNKEQNREDNIQSYSQIEENTLEDAKQDKKQDNNFMKRSQFQKNYKRAFDYYHK